MWAERWRPEERTRKKYERWAAAVAGTKNAFNALISRLDMAEERISELDIAAECSKNKENKTWRWGWRRSKPEDRKVIWWPKYLKQTILVSYLAVRQETVTFWLCVCQRESLNQAWVQSLVGELRARMPCAMWLEKREKERKGKPCEEKLLLLLTSWLPILYSAMWKCTAGRGGDFGPVTREGITSTQSGEPKIRRSPATNTGLPPPPDKHKRPLRHVSRRFLGFFCFFCSWNALKT